MRDPVQQKLKTRLNDEAIRDYWLELFSDPPLSEEKFLDSLFELEDQKMYRWIDIRMYTIVEK